MPVSRPRAGSEAVHLLVDSIGLKLCGPGEWLVEKHAAKVRWSCSQPAACSSASKRTLRCCEPELRFLHNLLRLTLWMIAAPGEPGSG